MKKEKKERKKPEFWTAAEDRILHELLAAIAKKQIWAMVQADGRLAHKGCSGIHMRLKTLVSVSVSTADVTARQGSHSQALSYPRARI